MSGAKASSAKSKESLTNGACFGCNTSAGAFYMLSTPVENNVAWWDKDLRDRTRSGTAGSVIEPGERLEYDRGIRDRYL